MKEDFGNCFDAISSFRDALMEEEQQKSSA